MTRTLLRFATISFFAMSVALVGCSEDGTLGSGDDDVTGSESLETLDLDQEFGGLSYSDESVAFGDDDLLVAADVEDLAAMAADDEDSLTDDDPTLEGPMYKRTLVRILWGQLEGEFDRDYDPSEGTRLDWSGSVSVSEGVVALKRTILFERPYDHRLPRETRDSLSWVSHTGPHFDGVLVMLITPLVEGVPQGEMTLVTPQYRATFSVRELQEFELVSDVDDMGNAISLQSMVIEPGHCAMGHLNGFWKSGEDRPETDAIEMGGFRGRFMSHNGLATGFLAGVYGLNSEGERVFFGKYIGRNGRVMGLLGGTWAPDESGDGVGEFQGRWVNRVGNVKGQLQGRYRENAERQIGDGFFEGRWAEACTGSTR